MKLVQIPEETAKILHTSVVDAITSMKNKERAAQAIVAAGVLAQAMTNPVKPSGRPKKSMKDKIDMTNAAEELADKLDEDCYKAMIEESES